MRRTKYRIDTTTGDIHVKVVERVPEGHRLVPEGCTCSSRCRRSTIHGKRTAADPTDRFAPRRAALGDAGRGPWTPAISPPSGPTIQPRPAPARSLRAAPACRGRRGAPAGTTGRTSRIPPLCLRPPPGPQTGFRHRGMRVVQRAWRRQWGRCNWAWICRWFSRDGRSEEAWTGAARMISKIWWRWELWGEAGRHGELPWPWSVPARKLGRVGKDARYVRGRSSAKRPKSNL